MPAAAIGAIAGGLGAGSVAGGMTASTGAALGAVAGASYDQSKKGADAQTEAMKKASEQQSASANQWQTALLDFQKEVYQEGAPWREAQQRFLAKLEPLLMEDVSSEPGSSPFFTQALSKGSKALMGTMARYRLEDSGASGVGLGELSTGLMSNEMDKIRNMRMSLLGFMPTDTTGYAGNLLSNAANTGMTNATNMANLTVGQGAVQGGMYGATGQNMMQLPLMYSLLGGSFGK